MGPIEDPPEVNSSFRAAYSAVNQLLMATGTAQPLTLGEAYFLGDISPQQGLPVDTVVGQRSTMTGYREGVAHRLDITMHDEKPGYNSSSGVIAGILVSAAEGEVLPDDKSFVPKPGAGAIVGLVTLNTDGSIASDFGHGTVRSASPEVQSRLQEICLALGWDSEKVFAAQQAQIYNPAQVERFTHALEVLAASPSVL